MTKTKAEQFQEELQELLNRYQYKLAPFLEYKKDGIYPRLGLVEIVPEKKDLTKKDKKLKV